MTHSVLRLGIALLEEGNRLVQGEMLAQLRAMDVGFLSSMAHLVAGCSVLDWGAYERYQRSETMQSSSSLGQFCFTLQCVWSGEVGTDGLSVCGPGRLVLMASVCMVRGGWF